MTGSKGEDILTHFLQISLCVYMYVCMRAHVKLMTNLHIMYTVLLLLHKKDSFLICISNISPTTQICCDLAQIQKM